MNIELKVDTDKFTIELDLSASICELCSRIEDHAHSVKLCAIADDTIDGERLSSSSRKVVVRLMQGCS